MLCMGELLAHPSYEGKANIICKSAQIDFASRRSIVYSHR